MPINKLLIEPGFLATRGSKWLVLAQWRDKNNSSFTEILDMQLYDYQFQAILHWIFTTFTTFCGRNWKIQEFFHNKYDTYARSKEVHSVLDDFLSLYIVWKLLKMSHSDFKKLAKMDKFWHFFCPLTTQNVNVARFARNVRWDIFVIFKHCAFLLLKIRHFSDFLIVLLGLYLMSKCGDVISCEALENGLMT